MKISLDFLCIRLESERLQLTFRLKTWCKWCLLQLNCNVVAHVNLDYTTMVTIHSNLDYAFTIEYRFKAVEIAKGMIIVTVGRH